jgi:hypothetical protein
VLTGSPTVTSRLSTSFAGQRGSRCARGNDIDLRATSSEISSGKTVPSLRPSILDDDVSALNVAEVAQSFAKGPDEIGLERSGGVAEETYAVDFLLLSARSKRRGERADPKGDEQFSPQHH